MSQIIIILFILFALITIFTACAYNSGNRKVTYQTEKIVVDDEVIDLDDEQGVIAPLWWSVSVYDGEKNMRMT